MHWRCATGVSLGLLAVCGAVAASAQAPAVTAFENVSVIPMAREEVLARQTVLVKGDRILKMGPAGKVRVPADAIRIDGQGKYLLPGLADMHAHLWDGELGTFQFLGAGVTTVREMLADDGTLALKARITKGEIVGPRIYTATRGGSEGCEIQQVTKCVAAVKAAGYDFIKYSGSGNLAGQTPASDSAGQLANNRQALDSLTTAGRRVGIGVSGHMDLVGIEWALRTKVASIEHDYGYIEYVTGFPSPMKLDASVQLDTAKLAQIAAATRRAGSWVVPTLAVLVTIEELAPRREAKRQQMIQFYLQVAKALHDAGVGMLMGTDVPQGVVQMVWKFSGASASGGEPPFLPGPAVRRELQLLVRAGLTPYQALETATRNAAVFLGTLDRAGTIEAGKNADLVLLSKNPLEDIRNMVDVVGVMVGGRWLSRAKLDDPLQGIRPAP